MEESTEALSTEPDERGTDRKSNPIKTYIGRLKAFSTNARLFLVGGFLFGIAGGINQLLFNFYVLSQGYTEGTLGKIVTARSLTTLLAAIPMGYLVDKIGRKRAFFFSHLSFALSIVCILLFPSIPVFLTMGMVQGLAQSLSVVAQGPFLMENSEETERTYLFSISSGIGTTASSVGQWFGGFLPGIFAGMLLVSAMDTKAYSAALWFVVLFALLALVPISFIKENRRDPSAKRSVFAPVTFFKRSPKTFTRLILPGLVTSIGAGMVMPFMNVFFRNVYRLSDNSIGVIFAWGSLAMGIGLIIAPMIAERVGKIQTVVATQALSIPFLVLLGFSGRVELAVIAYYFRLTLMNMSSPIFSTFAMEQVEPEARAMLASLNSMAFNFGWAFSPTISGILQERHGFGPSFTITIILYTVSTSMYYFWFWHKKNTPATVEQAQKLN